MSPQSHGSWNDKVVLITGGTAGLGRSLVGAFARRGAQVVVWARDSEKLAALSREGAAKGWRIDGISVDVTDDQAVHAAAQDLRTRWGRLDGLVNVVGRSTRCDVATAPLTAYRDLMEINFFSVVRCTSAVLGELIRCRGHLVNIGSLASKTAWPFVAPYASSKFALAAYTQQLRLETPRALHVMLVCPGPIRRVDAGSRYATESSQLPSHAGRPGAGAPMKGLDPDRLAERIVRGCERRRPELIVPRWPRFLFALGQISATLGDWMIHRLKGTRRPDESSSTPAPSESMDENAASPV